MAKVGEVSKHLFSGIYSNNYMGADYVCPVVVRTGDHTFIGM